MNKRQPQQKRKFKKIYYIIQTVPQFKTCGHAFKRSAAEIIAQQVYLLTGEPGQIVEFSREELQRLGYKKYVKSSNSKR